jgi:hypothetical protein
MWLITVWDTPNVFATERVSSMSLFETFVQTELPQRAVMLTDYNTGGYTGNPNSATLDKIKFAPSARGSSIARAVSVAKAYSD